MTRDNWVLLGAGTIGIAAIAAIYLGKSNAALSPSVDPLYSQSLAEGPTYLSYNAPKTYIPVTSTAPCGCGANNTTLFGSTAELAQQLLSNAQAVLSNIRSAG
jgi:hypothetical protein